MTVRSVVGKDIVSTRMTWDDGADPGWLITIRWRDGHSTVVYVGDEDADPEYILRETLRWISLTQGV